MPLPAFAAGPASTLSHTPSGLQHFPPEILQIIFENLEVEELYGIMDVSSRWRHIATVTLASKFKNISITLWLDQEGHRPYQPVFKFASYNPTTCLMRFDPVKSAHKPEPRDVFNTSFGISRPSLRIITVGHLENMDYLEKGCDLSVKTVGRKTLAGSEPTTRGIPSNWSLTYDVKKFVRPDGQRVLGERWFIPEAFECTIGFLNPNRAHKARLLWFVKKATPFARQSQRKKVNDDVLQESNSDLVRNQPSTLCTADVY